ncbi:hypothetical protein VZT92_002139 [Zoarces viviparus]|uniref:C2H2-type domain-containing protein n=1 Tax=Zoarces viviparus TaxID=48416 RepID=A0AAW1FZX1_ZOAVI
MSADDFQTKYSSVMESMLKSAIAETTKLFETMVDELKAEISRVKKENEDLKIRCSHFENARNQPTVHSRERDPLHGPSDVSEKRDRAVQCDLVPLRTMLVEQCQPLVHSSLQNQEQQCSYEQMEHSLQDHTYGEGTTQMTFIIVKQEDSYDDSSQQSVLKQEEDESLVCGQVLSEQAGSPQASATENEGILELPYLGMDSGLQGAQNQSSELEHSQVLSLAAIKDNIEEVSEMSEEPNDIQEKASLSCENCVILEEDSPDSRPSTSSKLSAPVVENSPKAINKTEQPALKGTAGEPTYNSDEEIISIAVQDFASSNDPPMEEEESTALIHLTPITTKDTSDPHLQMSKAQFLAQLAVTPVPEEPKQVSSDDSVKATAAEISTREKPHSCPHCPKNFTQSGHLKKHVKNVHKVL